MRYPTARRGRSRRKGTDLSCAFCRRSFYRAPSNRASRNGRGRNDYCSRQCMSEAYKGRISPKKETRIEVRCAFCGAALQRPQWHVRKSERAFCTRECFAQWKSQNWTAEYNPSWRGGRVPYYGGNWKRQQRDARRRDHHQCQRCGLREANARRALDVHHIRPFRLFGIEHYREANQLTNLITLCDRCHTLVEHRDVHHARETQTPPIRVSAPQTSVYS